MKLFTLCSLLATFLLAEETETQNDDVAFAEEISPPFSQNTTDLPKPEKSYNFSGQLYGQVSILTGPGASLRARKEKHGFEINVCAGTALLLGFGVQGGGSWLYFPTNRNFYLSCGINGLYTGTISGSDFRPAVPLFLGIAFKYGFIDIGATTIPTNELFLFPIPTLRAGFSF